MENSMCMCIAFYKLDIHTQFYFLLKLKMACSNLFHGKDPHPSKKALRFFSSPNLCDYYLWSSWLQTNAKLFLPHGVF